MEKDIPSKQKPKERGDSYFISDKIDFKQRLYKRHYIIIKGSVQQEAITFINIYGPNIGATKYMKQRFNRPNRQQYNSRGLYYPAYLNG